MVVVRLPRLCESGAGSYIRFPLSAGGASALAEALLTDQHPTKQERLAALLRGEPPLLLWCVLRAGQWPDTPPTGIAEVAAWLAGQALNVLRWNNVESAPGADSFNDQQPRWTHLFQAALATAGNLSQEAELLALLGGAKEWIAAAKDPNALEADYRLPAWLDALPAGELPSPECGEADQRVTPIWCTELLFAESLPRLVEKLARLAALETEFAATLEREKLASLKELAYGASHEINNPLANISTRAQTLLRDETDPERRRKLATINSQAFRAHEMISDMMLFAKPPRLTTESVDIVKLVDTVISEMQVEAREQGTSLARRAAPESLLFMADPGQLAVAFKAVAKNSLEAIGRGGRVEFEIRTNGASHNGHASAAEIVVTDTGPGISAEVRRHLFDPFYSGREAGRGLGFGLAKCWRIITDHGGAIDVRSEPGRGATFVMRLPLK